MGNKLGEADWDKIQESLKYYIINVGFCFFGWEQVATKISAHGSNTIMTQLQNDSFSHYCLEEKESRCFQMQGTEHRIKMAQMIEIYYYV